MDYMLVSLPSPYIYTDLMGCCGFVKYITQVIKHRNTVQSCGIVIRSPHQPTSQPTVFSKHDSMIFGTVKC